MRTSRTYAGVGSRETPGEVLAQMRELALWLSGRGWTLRTGGADGADTAFAEGAAPGTRVIIPGWPGMNGHDRGDEDVVLLTAGQLRRCSERAETIHPRWQYLRYGAKKLHARNVAQVMGVEMDDVARAVVCWTRDGRAVGGTATAINLALRLGVPVLNLGATSIEKVRAEMERLEGVPDPMMELTPYGPLV